MSAILPSSIGLTPVSRRIVLSTLSSAGVGVLLPRCESSYDDDAVREFVIDTAVSWEPANLLDDFAFTVVKGLALDFVDARCKECGEFIRAFMLGASIASIVLSPCPGCAIAVRVTLMVSRYLLAELRSHAFAKARGLLEDGRYRVAKVGPTTVNRIREGVERSAVSYDVESHEPTGTFDRLIPAMPQQIRYFTEVSASAAGAPVTHVWRCNGKVTDRISLEVGSRRWRTFSRKQNLQTGVWMVEAHARNGAVLDTREFHIG
jgi:hypothetical protein